MGGVHQTGEEGTGSGIPEVTGNERNRGKFCNIAQIAKRWELTKPGREPGFKGTGSVKLFSLDASICLFNFPSAILCLFIV